MAIVYLSGPITGNANYKIQFAEAKKKLEAQGHEVINPAELEAILPRYVINDHKKVVDFCLTLLETATAICLLPGWEKSTGCCTEYGFAVGRMLTVGTLAEYTKNLPADEPDELWDGILGRT